MNGFKPGSYRVLNRPLCQLCLKHCPINNVLGGSPGLVVLGRDSRSEGRGFKSRHVYWMDIFSNIFVVKIVMMFA